jgi:HAD superfamily hydrolase (TIGR01509 family)
MMQTIPPQAFLFDLNGTMIDDMPFHMRAWQHILNNDLKAGLTPEEVKAQMYGKNEELLVRVFGPDHFTKEEMQTLSVRKEQRYQKEFLPHLKLIKGLDLLLHKAYESGIKMGIGTAAITFNVDFILDNLGIRHYFNAIVSADEVAQSKPHPETFLKGAHLLSAAPKDCVVFEDAPKGVEAALNAGMSAVVLTTMHGKDEFESYPNVLGFIQDYADPVLNDLLMKQESIL